MYGMNRGPRGFGGPGMGRGMGGPGMRMHHGPVHGMHRGMFVPMMGMGMMGGRRFRRRGSFFGGIIPGLLIGLLAYFFFF